MPKRRAFTPALSGRFAGHAFLSAAWLAASLLAVSAPVSAQTPTDPGRANTLLPAAPGVLATQALPTSTITNTRVGAGDVLRVTVFGQPDLSAEVGVNEKGTIAVALVGNVPVAGLTVGEVATRIADALRNGGYLLRPEVSVEAIQVRSQMVSVLGEVRQPGRYPIPGRLTVLELLATAGGLTEQADASVTLLRRPDRAEGTAGGDGERIPVRLGDSTGLPERTPLDVELRTGDVVYVDRKKLFYIHGEVNRPGAYPMEPGMTVMRAIAIGGGMNLRASARRIDINRTVDGVPQPPVRSGLAAPVQPGDVVFVNESLF